MRQFRFWQIAGIAIMASALLSACQHTVRISQDTTDPPIDSPVGKLIVDPGVTVTFKKNKTIDSNDTIEIKGRIVTLNGKSITLKAKNDINITAGASIETGAGADGRDDFNVPAHGGPGKPGGKITIYSTAGKIAIAGTLTTGEGGDGGGASAAGNNISAAYATSGVGGMGGEVTISAEKDVTISGKITTGSGGDGGKAEAVVGLTETVSPNVGAESHSGGASGGIFITSRQRRTSTVAGGKVKITATGRLKTGNGGNTLSASARGGKIGIVTVPSGGKSGPIKITAGGSQSGNGTAETGNGGNSGETPQTLQAFASGTVIVNASAGGGGMPGDITGMTTGTSTVGQAGDSGTSRVFLAAISGASVIEKKGSVHSTNGGIRVPGRSTNVILP